MQFNKKVVGLSLLGIAVFFALVLLGLPPLIRHIAVNKITDSTGRSCQIAKVSLNPFKLTAEVSGIRLAEKGSSAVFFSLSSAKLSLSPLSLPKRSFIIKELQLRSPYVHVLRDAPNHYNFSDLVTPKKEAKKEGTPFFSLNNIIIKRGSIDFEDKALRSERDHHLREISISIPFVSNIPYLADQYVTPHFGAVINGSPFRFDGQLKPLTRAVEAVVDVNIKDVDLPFYLGYLPVPLPVKVSSGKLGTAVEVAYRVDEKNGPEVRLSGRVGLDGLTVKEPDGAPLVGLERAQLKIGNAALISKVVDVSALEFEGLDVTATRDKSGMWNFQRVAAAAKNPQGANEPTKANPSRPPAAKGGDKDKGGDQEKGEDQAQGEKKKAGKPLQLRVALLSLTKSKVHLADHVPAGGFKTDLKEVGLTVKDFSLAEGHQAPLLLNVATARGETVALKGELVAQPAAFRGNLALKGIPLKDYYPYLADTLAAPITGTVSFDSDLSYGGGNVVIEKAAVKAEKLAAPFGQGEGVQLREAVISGIGVDLKKAKAIVQRVDLKGGSVVMTGYQGGGFSYERLLKAKPKAAGAKTPPKAEKKRKTRKEEAAAPFSYRIEKIAGSDFGIKYTDRTNSENPVFTLSRLSFNASNVTGPKLAAVPVSLSSGFNGKGRIHAAGTVQPQPLGFKGTVTLHGIPLPDFDPYLPEDMTVFLADGALDTTMQLNLVKGATGFTGTFAGSLGVRSFYCQETVYDEDLLKWENLAMDRVSGTLSPFTLAINQVSLSNFYSRVIVERDGTLNLQHLREGAPAAEGSGQKQESAPAKKAPAPRATGKASVVVPGSGGAMVPVAGNPHPAPLPKGEAGTARTATSAVPTPAPGGETPAQPHPIRIETITMQGGTLAFADRHLQTPFDTTFYNLGGRVSGLTSEASKVADVDLRGNLENHSPLAIKGVINPLRGDLYLDMKISFNDIELSPFSPYANTYLGYMIDKGKLSLDLMYKIDKKTLSSQNRIFIDQFTFGNAVESPKATKLPVRLAIALLKDRKGEIHLDLPVAGRTDDPKFSVWHVVLQVLKNLLVKAATSPMALLGSMFGHGEDFSAIAFAPGSDQLSKPEQDKLAKLSTALHDRPSLNLEISGFVDKEPDAEGYRNEVLLKKMKAEKFRRLVKEGKTTEGQTPDKVEILPQEYGTYLKAVYQKEKFSKPRNALGFAKDLPDAEMKKLIITHTVVGDNELHALARERVENVKAYLVQAGKIPAERLFEKGSDIYKPAAKGGTGSRVEFGANVK